ncbi:MAG TPA: DUF3536 domain-containing protein, partial [Verrucomicrobiae bacterium]
QYAARALQLADELGSGNLEPEFLNILAQARSNIPEHQDGRVIYEKFVKPAIITRETVGAHFAISSLFESYGEETRIYSYRIRQEDRQLWTAGAARMAVGRVKVTFAVTGNCDVVVYGVVHLGEHNLNCGVRFFECPAAYEKLVTDAKAALEHADFPELIRVIDRHFAEPHYSLKNLFRDEQAKVLGQILASTRADIFETYRRLTDRYAPLARFLQNLHAPMLEPLAPAAEFVLNTELERQFSNGSPDAERVKTLVAEAQATHANLNTNELAFVCTKHFQRLGEQLQKTPEEIETLQHLSNSAALLPLLPFQVNLWKAQNVYDQVAARLLPEMKERQDEKSRLWVETFYALGEQLGFHIHRN